jgi:hypothetical protein
MATRSEATNFIRHQLKIRDLFTKDDRLTAWHISLYWALFFEWNECRFQSPFFISRMEMMNTSKIGSVNTYLKCLKELDQFGYISYKPSHNPSKGSTVSLFTFNTSSDTNSGTTTNISSDTTGVQAVIPFNKHIKQIKDNKGCKGRKDGLQSVSDMDDLKIVPLPKSDKRKILFSSPSLNQVKSFFLEKNKTDLEAEKFFNHFESNGWLVGGKTKMKNWQAAARNWIARSEEFNSDRFLSSSKDRLNVNQNKDYSVPL